MSIEAALGEIVPIVVIDDAAHADPLADALAAGGVRCAEVTLRTPAAIDVIRALARRDGFTVGAGTVLSADDVVRAVDGGAQFLVSPGLDTSVLGAALAESIPYVPGVATATEIQRASRAGVARLKLFPAQQLGGPALIDALAGPFAGVSFMPSGGVNPSNAAEYLSKSSVFAISSSWITPRALIADGDFDEIRRRCAEIVMLSRRLG
ncbi:bifunctional 4-hydroxy-2-oxoglutarate aldolase/2-dehydro-3-deoxy-phosphogluconate aldolase [Agrococcus sp. KRD186]|uniref:bifunctional 4-hydroxy-2-oxoglutarate aldolase/2-dehydro-3-deoxy-phosphogluconate aldolase n=1 Tax=Agrococcus sp. KRD186 TaxID=2729730 RepID=UPI0019D07B9E|nr:bifunctional 4-hydroxy-2-oxoglutarate aldolase/2-dehydro-3-deoxy-phosphogluconate aldolase [Agrococcus sp. KRD186]